MATVTVAHTANLDRAAREAVWLLVRDSFPPGGFTAQDWDHALGGMHTLVHDGGALVAHGSVIQRRLLVQGRSRRVGYVEAVAVAAGARRRGHGAAVMGALETVIRAAYDFGALSATDDGAPLYRSRGWEVWQGPTAVLTPDGVVPTPDDDGDVYVLGASEPLDRTGRIVCDWRDGDPW